MGGRVGRRGEGREKERKTAEGKEGMGGKRREGTEGEGCAVVKIPQNIPCILTPYKIREGWAKCLRWSVSEIRGRLAIKVTSKK